MDVKRIHPVITILVCNSSAEKKVRTKPRDVQRLVAKQTVTLPKELLPGKYVHVAIIKIGDKTEQSEQIIEIAALKVGTKQYAFKGVSK